MENEYPRIDKDIWDLKLFEIATVETEKNVRYELIRVMGGWLWMGLVFIPFSHKADIENIGL